MELFQSWYLLAVKSPLGLTREWICTIKWNLYTAFNGEMLMGGPLVRAVGEEVTAVGPWPLLISSCLQIWWGRKGQHIEKGLVPGRLPTPWDWHLQAESGWILPGPASHHMSSTYLTLPLRLCGIKAIAELKFIFKVRTMSYVLVYLICVMISPLQIWILIKKYILVSRLYQFIGACQGRSGNEFMATTLQHKILSVRGPN